MFSSFVKKFIGSKNEREIKKMWPIVERINAFEGSISTLSDEQLKLKTQEFKVKQANAHSVCAILTSS